MLDINWRPPSVASADGGSGQHAEECQDEAITDADQHDANAVAPHNFVTKNVDIVRTVECMRCGVDGEKLPGTRYRTKAGENFICSVCNGKGVALHRKFTWPSHTFKAMGASAKKAFWLSIRDTPNAQLEETIVK